MRWARAIGLLVAVILPLAVLVWARTTADTRLDRVDPSEPAVTANPIITRSDGRRIVSVEIAWEEPRELVAPLWSGTVTALPVQVGAEVSTGIEVVEIDRVRRVAVWMDRPFHRPLTRGDRGPDVDQLQSMLDALGHAVSDSPGIYGSSTARAVDALARDLGAPTAGGFDPGWIVWLPEPTVTLSALELTVGAGAPGPGTTIATGQRRVKEVAARVDGSAVDLSGEWVLRLGDRDVLMVDGVPAEPDHPAFQGLPPGPEPIAGEIRRRVPTELMTLPAAAVAVGADASTCVWVRAAGEDDYEAVQVEVGPGPSSMLVAVSSGLSSTDEVLVNHASQLASSTCPS